MLIVEMLGGWETFGSWWYLGPLVKSYLLVSGLQLKLTLLLLQHMEIIYSFTDLLVAICAWNVIDTEKSQINIPCPSEYSIKQEIFLRF